MAIDASTLRRLRRMVAEPTADTYTDDDLRAIVEAFVVTDTETRFDGRTARERRYALTPLTYDLNAAAAQVWEEKLNALVGAGTYDYSADGQSFSLSQLVEQYKQRYAFYQSKKRVKSIRMIARRTRDVSQDYSINDNDDL